MRAVAAGCAGMVAAAGAPAGSAPAPAPDSGAGVPPGRNLIVVEEWIIPEPDEFFAAVEKKCAADWLAAKRPLLPTNFTNRQQIALNFGGLLADAHIAIETRAAQSVSNIARDLLQLATSLGIAGHVEPRIEELDVFAEAGQWEKLNLSVNLLGEVVGERLVAQKDGALDRLVQTGGYLRGLEVLSGMVASSYDREAASLLRQPHLAEHLRALVAQLPAAGGSPPALRDRLLAVLERLRDLMGTTPGDIPELDAVREIHRTTADINADIASKGAL